MADDASRKSEPEIVEPADRRAAESASRAMIPA